LAKNLPLHRMLPEGKNYLSNKILRMESSEIRKAFELASRIEKPLNLSIGQPDFPVPEPVKEAMIKAIRDNKNSYTPTTGIPELRERISRKWKEENGFYVQPENIIVSTGVASLLMLLFETMFNEGDHILLVEPYFLIYPSLSKFNNLNMHFISEDFDPPSLDSLADKLSQEKVQLKAIIFSNPSNPTGKILSREQLTSLAGFAQKTGAIIISDEIYETFDYDKQLVSTAFILPEQTITLNGFSKSHAMTGLRLGYAGFPENLSAIAGKMAALQQYSVVCAPHPVQWAGIAALDNPIQAELASMKKRRDYVVQTLEGKARFTHPSGAFYAFPEVPLSGEDFSLRAAEKKLIVVPGHIFTAKTNHIRISYAVSEEILEEGLSVFVNLLQDLN